MEWKDISKLEGDEDVGDGTKCLVECTGLRGDHSIYRTTISAIVSAGQPKAFGVYNLDMFVILRYCVIDQPPRRLRTCPFCGSAGKGHPAFNDSCWWYRWIIILLGAFLINLAIWSV